MVLDLMIGAAISLLNGVLGLLPSWTPPSWDTFGGSLGAAMSSANNYIPLTTVGACLLVILGLRLFLFAWGGVVYVYRLIPLKFT